MTTPHSLAVSVIILLTMTRTKALSLSPQHSLISVKKRYIEYCYSDQDCADKQADIDRRNIIIGCVVGVAFLLLLISIIITCVRRRRRIQNYHANPGWVTSNYAATSYPMQQPNAVRPQQEQTEGGYMARPVPAYGQGPYSTTQQNDQVALQHPQPGYTRAVDYQRMRQ